jgi:hypothetical protein
LSREFDLNRLAATYVSELRRVIQREFEIKREEVGLHTKEGMDGIESFGKGMVMIARAQNVANRKVSCRTPFSGVQSKQIFEDRVTDKPIFRRR